MGNSYGSPQFNVRTLIPVGFGVDLGVSGGTTVAVTDRVATLPKFIRRTEVQNVRLRCTAIPNAAATNLVVSFLNGSDVFATATVTAASVDDFIDATVDSTYSTFAAGVQPTVSVAGTATDTSDSLGDYDIWFEIEEQFA